MLEIPIEDGLDINGWDLFKTLGLLKKSNPRLFEWFNSPIVYIDRSFSNRFVPIMNCYFFPKNAAFHYLHTAKNQRDHFLHGELIKLKKYLYTLHPLMAAKWVLERRTPPPVVFRELMKYELSENMSGIVEQLLYDKVNLPEMSLIEPIHELDEYIDQQIEYLDVQLMTFGEENNLGWEQLNNFFFNELYNENK